MRIIKLTSKGNKDMVREVSLALKEGKVVVVPTDTVYGLIAKAPDEKAVRKVFEIKQRPIKKPLPVFVRDIAMAERLAFLSGQQKKILERFWPGQLTAVLKAKSKELPPGLLNEEGKIGLRVPDHEFLLSLLREAGFPLTGTSANISGEDSFRDAEEILSRFQKEELQPDMVIDGGRTGPILPSTVVDLVSFEIIRKGAVPPDDIFKAREG
ncbi:MAG: threonylcarbamoyl-AMP synthase [Candidatus Nealsonbacteria bacterium]|nr:threonylcarbamoyl-AMP synthase [Candidatus Nealsonbacteria bacterium]